MQIVRPPSHHFGAMAVANGFATAVNGDSIRDPILTELGRRQCETLREHLKTHVLSDKKVGLIVVSPMRRTLETCLIALDWLVEEGVRVEPDARYQG